MPRAIDVAEYFLCLEGEDGEITNMKLQKLVYYAQGFSLALLDRPLFDDRIEAWMHGPVVPDLYRKFSDFKSNPIPPSKDFDPTVLSRSERNLIEEVYDVYGQYSAFKLRRLTHEEDPWINNYVEGLYSREIPLVEIKDYFNEYLVN